MRGLRGFARAAKHRARTHIAAAHVAASWTEARVFLRWPLPDHHRLSLHAGGERVRKHVAGDVLGCARVVGGELGHCEGRRRLCHVVNDWNWVRIVAVQRRRKKHNVDVFLTSL